MTKTIIITTFTGKTFQFEAHNIRREIIDGVDIYFIDGNSYPAEIVEIQEQWRKENRSYDKESIL